MRQIIAAAFLSVLAFSPATAGAGHWSCTADGIRIWTYENSITDVRPYSYDGDRFNYNVKGRCHYDG